MDVVFSPHAKFEISRRQLSEDMVTSVVQSPQQAVELTHGRKVYQSRYFDSNEDKEMLLRVICQERRNELFVITAYRTSRIDKYWAKEAA